MKPLPSALIPQSNLAETLVLYLLRLALQACLPHRWAQHLLLTILDLGQIIASPSASLRRRNRRDPVSAECPLS